MLREAEAIFDDLRDRWGQQIGVDQLKELESADLVGTAPVRFDTPGWLAAQDPGEPLSVRWRRRHELKGSPRTTTNTPCQKRGDENTVHGRTEPHQGHHLPVGWPEASADPRGAPGGYVEVCGRGPASP